MSTETSKTEIRYCVTAYIDLLGFASHLEIASDLRTNIGQAALDRLQTLEDAIALMEKERKICPLAYPENYYFIRINDAVIFTLDLPQILKPSVGQSII